MLLSLDVVVDWHVSTSHLCSLGLLCQLSFLEHLFRLSLNVLLSSIHDHNVKWCEWGTTLDN